MTMNIVTARCTVSPNSMTLTDPQPAAALLVDGDVQWVAHRIVSHDSEFLEQAPGAATPCSGYSLPPWEITDVLLCPGSISTEFPIGGSELFEWCP